MSGHMDMPAVYRRRRGSASSWPPAWLGVLLSFLVAAAHAQEDAAPDGAASSAEESRQVDESEESFRARMELREQRLREQQRGTPTFSYSASQDGKLANLPPESQEHIRAQLRDRVIESRTWKPGEDLSGYPYEPSQKAGKDPGLARQEREAFIEQLEKYQQREAAHAAAPSGAAGEPGEPGDGNGSPAPGTPAVATAGVTESALDFLKQQGMAGASQAATEEDGAGQGGDGEAEDAEPGEAEGAASPQAAEAGDGSAGEQQQAAAAGTVAIAELASLDQVLAEGASAEESAQQDQNQKQNQNESESSITMRDVPDAEPEPGTVDVEALRRLDPGLVGARSADEDGQ